MGIEFLGMLKNKSAAQVCIQVGERRDFTRWREEEHEKVTSKFGFCETKEEWKFKRMKAKPKDIKAW